MSIATGVSGHIINVADHDRLYPSISTTSIDKKGNSSESYFSVLNYFMVF